MRLSILPFGAGATQYTNGFRSGPSSSESDEVGDHDHLRPGPVGSLGGHRRWISRIVSRKIIRSLVENPHRG